MTNPEDVQCAIAERAATAVAADVDEASAVANALLREVDLMLAELEGKSPALFLALRNCRTTRFLTLTLLYRIGKHAQHTRFLLPLSRTEDIQIARQRERDNWARMEASVQRLDAATSRITRNAIALASFGVVFALIAMLFFPPR